jgi:hypothetical protein
MHRSYPPARATALKSDLDYGSVERQGPGPPVVGPAPLAGPFASTAPDHHRSLPEFALSTLSNP